jgi:hypothetical protein
MNLKNAFEIIKEEGEAAPVVPAPAEASPVSEPGNLDDITTTRNIEPYPWPLGARIQGRKKGKKKVLADYEPIRRLFPGSVLEQGTSLQMPKHGRSDRSLNESEASWGSGSKVVGDDGELLTVYHGTTADFDKFIYDHLGTRNDQLGSGFYFTSSEQVARGYGSKIYEAKLDIKNPIDAKKSNYKLSPAKVLKIINESPDLEEKLWDYADMSPGAEKYGGGRRAALKMVVDTYSGTGNMVKMLNMISSNFFGYGDDIRKFNNIVKKVTGYDGVFEDFGDIVHWVAWFPEQIRIDKKKVLMNESVAPDIATFDLNIGDLISAVKKALENYNFSKYNLKTLLFEITNEKDAILVKSKSGRRYKFQIYENYLTMSFESSMFQKDEFVGLLSSSDSTMAWKIPDFSELISFENFTWKICEECIPYIIKNEVMKDVRIFCDLSIGKGMPEDDKKKIDNTFEIIDSRSFFWSEEEFVKRYIAKFKTSIDENKNIYIPVNFWNRKYWAHQDLKKIRSLLEGTKIDGHVAQVMDGEVIWGDVAKLRLFREFPSILEVRYDSNMDDTRWCCVHMMPNLPNGFEELFVDEMKKKMSKIKKLNRSSRKVDMVKIISGVWDEYSDQCGLGFGYAYYRDGLWGIEYMMNGMGQGLVPVPKSNSSIRSIRLEEMDGVINFSVDSGAVGNTTERTPAPCSVEIFIHPDTDHDEMMSMIRRYMYYS